LGWTDGRNARIEFRGATDADHIRQYAAELVALAPDVILSSGTAVAGPLLQATRTVPIVFAQVADPVGAGFVGILMLQIQALRDGARCCRHLAGFR
jgi:putative ABC transport system substrate-binding protein